tara:strand:- start:2364 stop:2834 length:471 start_codon:yes stop_codon:yes gene_type:complete
MRKGFTPKKFDELDREERQLRGRLSTLKRMIKRREDSIKELMIPINKKKKEIKKYKEELKELSSKIRDGFEFPNFSVESYMNSGCDYYRGVWRVDGKKKFKYLGSESHIFDLMNEKYDGFKSMSRTQKDKLIKEHFINELRLDYWEKEYDKFKKES